MATVRGHWFARWSAVGVSKITGYPEPEPEPEVLESDPVKPVPGPVLKFRNRWQLVPELGPENVDPEPVPGTGSNKKKIPNALDLSGSALES